MSSPKAGSVRADTDASLLAERRNTDRELGARVAVADGDADEVLRIARERADRLLDAARSATDASLPIDAQTKAAVELLLNERAAEDQAICAERDRDDALVENERRERREKICALLVLERETTDLHLRLERRSSDKAVLSRDEFLAQASHDLRGLMAAQRLYLSLLAKQAGDGEHARLLAPQIATLVQIDAQMERLIGDLVDMVAIEAGKLAVTLRPCSAAELLARAIAVFAPLAAERQQSLSIASIAADVTVEADAVRVLQVLGNLLSNAIKFTPPHGKICVGVETSRDEATFCVTDTGPGVPPAHAARIFERFVGSSSTEAGLGLGLFIASRLVDAHGGRLWLDNDVTAGSAFRFTLRRTSRSD